MILQQQKLTFARFFYAIDWSTFTFHENRRYWPDAPVTYTGTVEAIWFKRKNGTNAVCSGTLRSSFGKSAATEQDAFMQEFDGRYGGSTEYKWDGTEMWSENNVFTDMVQAHAILDPILQNFPNIPASHEGWYSIK